MVPIDRTYVTFLLPQAYKLTSGLASKPGSVDYHGELSRPTLFATQKRLLEWVLAVTDAAHEMLRPCDAANLCASIASRNAK